MYHAINEGIDMLLDASLPDDISSVNLITVTDGVDQGSYDLNSSYDSNAEYLDAIQARFSTETVNDIKINAYSYGVEKIFEFENIVLDSGDLLETNYIQLWWRVETDGVWGAWVERGEFDSDNATLTTSQSSSAVFVFVLDASSSLGTDFSTIQAMANDSIGAMIESYNYE